jgi:hypothetical protein
MRSDLGDCDAFVTELHTSLRDLYTLGARATLARYLENPAS